MEDTMDHETYPHIVIYGNPIDGFEYIGPFPNAIAAATYGNTDPHGAEGGDWWTCKLHAPAENEDGVSD
jgi:hypothetical protein